MKRGRSRGLALVRTVALSLLLGLLAGCGWVGYEYLRFVRTPLDVGGKGESVEVARGQGFKGIVAQFTRQGATHAPLLFWRALAFQLRVTGRLHAGEYALPAGITPRTLLANMGAGRVLQHDFTLVEGWTFRQVRAALAQAPKLRYSIAAIDDAAVMKAIGAPGENPEGRFLPETYAYVKGDSDLDLLGRAYRAMDKTLGSRWAWRASDLPLTSPYQALILASIVEKETGRADERAKIAGVFVRRLKDHMLLQTDPSVIYGMGVAYAGTIHKADLTTDTPYNTYTRPGLPPTPIAMPGKAAIDAALHPAPGESRYFVAKGDGTHVFARTLEEHNRNVACYQLKHCP